MQREDDILAGGLIPTPDTNPNDPVTRVRRTATKLNIPAEIADDYLQVTGKVESGNRQYAPGGGVLTGPPTRRTGARALGMGQVMPDRPGATTRTIQGRRYDLTNPEDNVEAGLRLFAAGGPDPVGRRLEYFGGAKARQQYERTGRIPQGGDGYTSYQQYVQKSMGPPQRTPPVQTDPNDILAGGLISTVPTEQPAATQPTAPAPEQPAAPAPQPQPKLTMRDAYWHFGPIDNRRLTRRQQRVLADAVAEDERKRAAGQPIEKPPLEYQQEMRKRAGLPPLQYNIASRQVQIGTETVDVPFSEKGVAPVYEPPQGIRLPNLGEVPTIKIRPQAERPFRFGPSPAETQLRQEIANQPGVFEGPEYDAFLRLNRQPGDSAEMRRQFLDLKYKQAIEKPGSAENVFIARDVEAGRQTRVSNMGWPEYLAQGPKSVVTGVTDTLAAGLKSIAVLNKKMDELTFQKYGKKETTDLPAYRLGQAIHDEARNLPGFLKSNPDLEQDLFVGQAPSTVGQVLSLLAGGVASKSPRLMVMVMGGGLTTSDAYDEARSLGATDEQAVNLGLLAGGLLGPTELLGVRGALSAIKNSARKATWNAALKEALVTGSREAAENAAQEIIQEGGQGILTGKPRTQKELLTAAALGAFGGAVTTTPLSLITSRPKKEAQPLQPAPDVTERAEEGPIQLPDVEHRPVAFEKPSAIAAQMDALLNRRGNRLAVLVPKGQAAPTKIPKGYRTTRTDEGVMIHPKELASEDVQELVRTGETWRLLGHANPDGPNATRIVVARAGRQAAGGIQAGDEIMASYAEEGQEQNVIEEMRSQFGPYQPYFEVGGAETATKVVEERGTDDQRAIGLADSDLRRAPEVGGPIRLEDQEQRREELSVSSPLDALANVPSADRVRSRAEQISPTAVPAEPSAVADRELRAQPNASVRFANLSNEQIEQYIHNTRSTTERRAAKLARRPPKGTAKAERQARPQIAVRQKQRAETRIAEAQAELERRRAGGDRIPSFQEYLETQAGGPAGGVRPETLTGDERRALLKQYDEQFYPKPHHSRLQRRKKRGEGRGRFLPGKLVESSSSLSVGSTEVVPEARSKDAVSSSRIPEYKGETVYHGTLTDFADFDPKFFNTRSKGEPGSRDAFFFSRDPESADAYAYDLPSNKTGRVISAKLELKNPLSLSRSPTAAQVRHAKERGYDGIVTPYEVAVFSPSQIRQAKSAPETKDAPARLTPPRRVRRRREGSLATGEAGNTTLSQFVRRNGGIAPAGMYRGEVNRLRQRETGTSGLVNARARQGSIRQTADIVMQMANDAGFRDPATGQPFDHPTAFLAAVERDVSGQEVRSTQREVADAEAGLESYYADQQKAHDAEVARVEMLESGRSAELFDRIVEGKATNAEESEFRQIASERGVEGIEIDDLIAGSRDEIAALQTVSAERAAVEEAPATEGRPLTKEYVDEEGTLRSETGQALFNLGIPRSAWATIRKWLRIGQHRVKREGNIIVLGEEAATALIVGDEEMPIHWGGEFNTVAEARARLARTAPDKRIRPNPETQPRMVADLEKIRKAIKAALDEGHTSVVIASPRAVRHERFHEASYRLGAESPLVKRHKDLSVLTDAPEYQTAARALLSMHYLNDAPVLVEEIAARIADGKHKELDLTRKQAIDWMAKWFRSFGDTHGDITLEQFKEFAHEAQRAIATATNEAATRETSASADKAIRSVQEGRESRAGPGDAEGEVKSRTLFSRGLRSLTESAFFKRWFKDSKVVDENGKPLVVYSGHGNMALYGERFDPKRQGASGAFYATESTEIASNYATAKLGGQGETHEGGSQYRFKQKNGKWGKKIWQVELTPEQQDVARQFINFNEEGEQQYDIEEYWRDNARYDADARRALARGGLRDLQSIWQFLEYMGDNIAYPESDVADAEGNRKPYFQRQKKNTFELLLDKLGIEWQSADWSQPGVFPVYLRVTNPIDAEKPFPPDLLAALKEAAKRTRRVEEGKEYDNKWTADYPLRQWVQEIEEGYEYWSTQVPQTAIPIIKQFGYDGIKEVGMKGEQDRAKRQINWIAFDSEQIKSATGNRGTFDPDNPNILYSLRGPKRNTKDALKALESLAKARGQQVRQAPAVAEKPARTDEPKSGNEKPRLVLAPPKRTTKTGEVKERSFPKSAEAAGYRGGTDRDYSVLTNQESLEKADREIVRVGADRAAADLAHTEDVGAPEIATGILLMQHYERNGDISRAVNVASDVARKLTQAGQTVQAASLISRLSPEGVLLHAQKLMKGKPLATETATVLVEQAKAVSEAEKMLAEIHRQRPDIFGPNGEILPRPAATEAKKDSGTKGTTRRSARARIGKLQDRLAVMEQQARERMEARASQAQTADANVTRKSERGAARPFTVAADLGDLVIIGAAKLGRKGITQAVWFAEMMKEASALTKKDLRRIYRESYEMYEQERKQFLRESKMRGAERQARGERGQIEGPTTPAELRQQGPLSPADYNRIINERNDAQTAARKARQQLARSFQDINVGRTIRYLRNAREVWNLSRSLITSLDLSAAGRQGKMGLVTHPKAWMRGFGRQFKALASSKQFERMVSEMELDPDYKYAQRFKLKLTSIVGPEEVFQNEFAGKIPWVRQSQQAYDTMLDTLRFGWFKGMLAKYRTAGMDLENSDLREQFIRETHNINKFTGRGGGKFLEKHGSTLSTFYFSPQFWASRLKVLAMPLDPRMYGARVSGVIGLEPFSKQARVDAWATLFGFYGLVAFQIGLAKALGAAVSFDPEDEDFIFNPDSADFMKVRAGNVHIDFSAGVQTHMRVIARLLKNFYMREYQSEKPRKGPLDILGQYSRGKESPNAALIHDLFFSTKKETEHGLKGTDFAGQPVFLLGEPGKGAMGRIGTSAIGKRILPIILQDAFEGYTESLSRRERALAAGLSVLGESANAYVRNYSEQRERWPMKGELDKHSITINPPQRIKPGKHETFKAETEKEYQERRKIEAEAIKKELQRLEGMSYYQKLPPRDQEAEIRAAIKAGREAARETTPAGKRQLDARP